MVEFMVSFDVESLLTVVLIEGAVTLVIKDSEGCPTTSVCRIPTHIDQYMFYDSNDHPPTPPPSISDTQCCQALIRSIEKCHH